MGEEKQHTDLPSGKTRKPDMLSEVELNISQFLKVSKHLKLPSMGGLKLMNEEIKVSLATDVNTKVNPDNLKFEIVERKGLGHPDSITDAIATLFSLRYSNYSLTHFDGILHHNFDKASLCAGDSSPKFGGGIINEPAIVSFIGRGVREMCRPNQADVERIPLSKMARSACDDFLSQKIGSAFEYQVETDKIKPGTPQLHGIGAIEANDTSFATSWSGQTILEAKVLLADQFLQQYSQDNPAIGSDIKIMGRRLRDTVSLTVAVAFVDQFVEDEKHYFALKDSLRHDLGEILEISPENVNLNAADKASGSDSQENWYLTVSGTSAECGDDGQVGRGNRVKGLIAPFRPQTLEAIAGKNPNKHVGNFYNVWASNIANRIDEELSIQNAVTLVSIIGQPITTCDVCVILENQTEKHATETKIKRIAEEVVGSHQEILQEMLAGKLRNLYPFDMISGLL